MGRKFLKTGVATAFASTAILVAAWGPSIGASASPKPKAYTWGLNAELSGPVSYFGGQIKSGLRAFVKSTDAHGGSFGHRINLISLDNQASESQAATNQTQLITADHALGIFGSVLSSDCTAVTAIAARYKSPMECQSVDTPSPWIYDLGDNNATSARADVAAAAKVTGLSHPKIAFVYINTLTDESLASKIGAIASAAGDQVVSSQQLQLTASDYSVPVANIVAAKPDAVVISETGPAFVAIQNQLASSGVTVPLIYIDGSTNMPQVVSDTASNVYPMFGATPVVLPTSKDKFTQSFVAAIRSTGVAPTPSNLNGSIVNAYIAAYAFSLAEHKCGSSCTGVKMHKMLDSTHISLGQLAPSYSFTATNHDPFSNWYVYHFVSGKFVPVGTYKNS